jgi:signal transduction histidine kinase/ActR/RegA family two-component response regulator
MAAIFAIFLFCRTDSELLTGCYALSFLYALISVPTLRGAVGFEIFAVRSSTFIVYSGLVLGKQGVVISTILNTVLGLIFSRMQIAQDPADATRLTALWVVYQARTISETCIMLISIGKFTETFSRLEEADKHKTEFLCRMSHELRTPLSGIIGAIDILKFAPLTDEYVKLINIAKTCSKNLLQVINDILDFSKIEAGKMKVRFDKVKPRELVTAVSEVITPLVAQKQEIEFKSTIANDVPESFSGDLTRIKQVLINLLSNAVKFTERGNITLRVTVDTAQQILDASSDGAIFIKSWANGKAFIKFVVEDTGTGVEPSDYPKIFSAFEQVSNRRNGQVVGGTGLGLNICLLLVKLMQGAVGVRSLGHNKGSAFFFWVPCEEQTDIDSEASEEEIVDIDSLTASASSVLLVDDNAVNQLVIKAQLVKLGCTVDVASNGLMAVKKFKNKVSKSPTSHLYDIVLLDLEMPIMNGITACRELREMGVTIPIIALTAHAVEEKRTMALKAGMDDFLMKPCSIDTLKQCLDKYAPK